MQSWAKNDSALTLFPCLVPGIDGSSTDGFYYEGGNRGHTTDKNDEVTGIRGTSA
jgi:hypothetical protein